MRIDEQIEERVRAAFSAAIARDGDAMVGALYGLTEQQAQQALGLALYACGFVVNDIFREGATDEEVRALAQQITETEASWVRLDVDTVAGTLRAAARGDASLDGVDHADLVGNAFVSGGHLLAAFRTDDQEWWQYLNEIWEHLEASR